MKGNKKEIDLECTTGQWQMDKSKIKLKQERRGDGSEQHVK